MFHTYSINSSFPNLDDRLHNRSDVSNIPSPFTVNEVNMRFIQITAMIQAGSSSSKVGSVFPMVVVSILFHVVFGPNDRRKDASNFTELLKTNLGKLLLIESDSVSFIKRSKPIPCQINVGTRFYLQNFCFVL